ncbi:hypothetical protein BD289DRAFT_192459 [Coniella lustricola]|uniref:Uncharacterized protein n=1 Tax=Coniella lustricola TaxID=2025994 RepID=A0A2T3AM35_9PEZI|nr:hypothetical protein BD289DRAFT_192459 [Coniella lustricola]
MPKLHATTQKSWFSMLTASFNPRRLFMSFSTINAIGSRRRNPKSHACFPVGLPVPLTRHPQEVHWDAPSHLEIVEQANDLVPDITVSYSGILRGFPALANPGEHPKVWEAIISQTIAQSLGQECLPLRHAPNQGLRIRLENQTLQYVLSRKELSFQDTQSNFQRRGAGLQLAPGQTHEVAFRAG